MRQILSAVLACAALLLPARQGWAEDAAPRQGGTLTIGVVSDPVTLDPAFFASYFELSAQYLMRSWVARSGRRPLYRPPRFASSIP